MKLKFRTASLNDSVFLYEVRNHVLTRAASHQSHLIAFDDHSSWLKKILTSDKNTLYIFELDEQPVGTVRYDFMNTNCGKLSWTVAPQMHNKGLGKEMVKIASMQFSGTLIAEIKEDNYGSKKIAAYIGMQLSYKINNIEYWTNKQLP